MPGYYTEPIRSYRKAQDVMRRKGRMGVRAGGQSWPVALRLGWSTYLVASSSDSDPAWYGILLHETIVVRFSRPHGDSAHVSFTCGGWVTLTTLQAMQKYSPERIGVRGRHIHSSKQEGHIYVRLDEGDDHDLAQSDGTVTVGLAVKPIYE